VFNFPAHFTELVRTVLNKEEKSFTQIKQKKEEIL
jgi:hypothetical protein